MAGVETRITEYSLPGVLGEIARATTIDVAVAIARQHGGRRLYVPREAKRDHPLCRLVGAKAAMVICHRWGGERYDIPSAKPFLHWYDARRLRAEGHTYAMISREIGVGMQHVRQLLDGFEAPAATMRATDATPHFCAVCGHRHRAKAAHGTPDPRQGSLF
jgi:hypothetical protein